jgi:glycine cleavage system T protein
MAELVRGPLADFHISCGAALGEYHGALVPARFTDPAAEHLSVRKSAGLFDFSFRAKFCMKGRDSVRFLQRIVSNDVKNLAPGQGTYATLLTAQGHIVADFRIYCAEDSFLLDTDADLLDKTIQALGRYIIADRVTIEPLPLCAVSVQGPQSPVITEKILQRDLPALAEYGHAAIELAGVPVRVVQASSTGEEGYEIWVGADGMMHVWSAFSGQAAGIDALFAGTEALESLRIEAGIGRYGADFGEDTLPLEAGLLDALSFTKGCYIGQEIVERARSRGHVNWKLVGLAIDSAQPPAAGEKLLSEGNEIGEVTSACVSPTLAKTIALGYVRREVSDSGTRLVLASGPAAQVAVLPFFRSRRGFCG